MQPIFSENETMGDTALEPSLMVLYRDFQYRRGLNMHNSNHEIIAYTS
jgi:hypothetical protein